MDAAAQKGFSAADSYDAHRPSYNPLAVERLFNALGLDGKSRVLDLAAGTGKFTTILSSRAEAMEIVAVEPHPDMLRVLRAKELDRVDVREGNAQAIPVEDRWADALIVAQVGIHSPIKQYAKAKGGRHSIGSRISNLSANLRAFCARSADRWA